MDYEENYFAERKFNFQSDLERFYPLALALKLTGCKKVLDVGCAYGALVYVLRRLNVEAWGVDVSNWARNISPVKEFIIISDLNFVRTPFDNEYFDCIVAINFFEHIGRLDHCIREIHRILRRGGILHASIPSYSRETLQDPYHTSVFSLNVWINIFRNRGFNLRLRTLLKFWTFFAVSWLLSRLKRKSRKKFGNGNTLRRPLPLRFIQWIRHNYKLVLNRV